MRHGKRSYWCSKKDATVHDLVRRATWMTKLKQDSCNKDLHQNTDKADIRLGNSKGNIGSKIIHLESIGSSTPSSQWKAANLPCLTKSCNWSTNSLNVPRNRCGQSPLRCQSILLLCVVFPCAESHHHTMSCRTPAISISANWHKCTKPFIDTQLLGGAVRVSIPQGITNGERGFPAEWAKPDERSTQKIKPTTL